MAEGFDGLLRDKTTVRPPWFSFFSLRMVRVSKCHVCGLADDMAVHSLEYIVTGRILAERQFRIQGV